MTAAAAALATAARRYGGHLAAAAGHFRPGAADEIRAAFDPVASPDTSDWAWARFLAGWPGWRPHRLDRRLLLPPADQLLRLAADCRTETPRPGLAAACADLLTAAAAVPGAAPDAALLCATDLGRAVESALTGLPAEWLPCRLARAAGRFPVWPTDPPAGPPAFLPWLAAILRAAADDGPADDAAGRVRDVVREALPDLTAAGLLPPETAADLAPLAAADPLVPEPWLHALAALLPPARAAADVNDWPALLARLTCRAVRHVAPGFVPPVDPVTLAVPGEWLRPEAADLAYVSAPGDRGTLVRVERFAVPPGRPRVVLSLGPVGPAVAAAWAAVCAAGTDLDRVRAALQPVVEAAALSDGPVPADVLTAVVDELGRLEPAADPAAVAARDAVLAAVREWAAEGGFTLLPADWGYAAGGPWLAEGEGVAAKPVFRRDVPAGRVARVKAFGLVGPGGLVRTADVVVSAGPGPAGLAVLEEVADGLAGTAGEELRAGLRALRPAGAGGYLELAALDLFTRYWDQVQPAVAAADPAAAAAFADGLRAMLAAAFGLELFAPHDVRDHPPGWVTLPPGTRVTTGRVTRVLRPGLRAGEALRVPARVEAE